MTRSLRVWGRDPRPHRQTSAPRVVVVGGGIAGLAAAARYAASGAAREVVLLEASDGVGGKLARAEVGGVTVDVGAESMLNRRPEAVVAGPRGRPRRRARASRPRSAANLWTRGRMQPMPRTLMGVPTDTRRSPTAASSPSPAWPAPPWTPVLPPTRPRRPATSASAGWSRSGSAARSSTGWSSRCSAGCTPATPARSPPGPPCPQVVALLDRDRSMMRAAAAAAVAGRRRVPVFAGLVGGRGPAARRAVVTAAGLDVRTGATVRDLARAADGGWNLVVGSTRDAEAGARRRGGRSPPRRAPSARLLADVRAGRGARAGPHRVRVDGDRHAGVPGRATSPTSPGSGLPGAAGRRPVGQGRDVLLRQVGLGPRRRARGRRAAGDALLDRAGTARSTSSRSTDEELVELALHDLADAIGLSRAAGRRARAAVGRRAAAVRRRPPRPGAPRSGAAVAAVPGLRSAARRTTGSGIPACIASRRAGAPTQVLDRLWRPAERMSA